MTIATHADAPAPGDALDDALAASFPASDPPAMTTPVIANLARRDDASHVGEADVAVYRVVGADHVVDAFSTAHNRKGGRWTSPGTPAVYVSLSPAGAVLEFLAHLEGESPEGLRLLTATLPRTHLVPADALPAQWRERPYRADVRALGDAWVQARRSLALQLPSVLCEGVANALLNPEHPDATRIRVRAVEALHIDPRLRY